MSDKPTNGNGNGGATGTPVQQFVMQQIFLKDLSFEAPNAPEVFAKGDLKPDTKLNIRSSNRLLAEDTWEVMIHLTVETMDGDETIFLIELQQAGIFTLKGYAEDQVKMLLGTYCPASIYPYTRELVSTTVARGGFPPLMLQPINFDALYAQTQEQQQQNS